MLGEELVNIGAKAVRHSKYVTLQMAEVAVPRKLFAAILDLIQRSGVPLRLAHRGCPLRQNEALVVRARARGTSALKRAGIVVPELEGAR